MKFTKYVVLPALLCIPAVIYATATLQPDAPDAASAPTPKAPEGYALVLNRTLAPKATLPSSEELRDKPDNAERILRDAGLQIFAAGASNCRAVTAPLRPTIEDAKAGKLSDKAMLAGVVAALTREQLGKFNKGYLAMKYLTPTQRALYERVAKNHGMLDKNGRPTQPGTQLMLYIPTDVNRYRIGPMKDKRKMMEHEGLPDPPSTAVASAPPLKGSVLWWMWPYAEAIWGNEHVTLKRAPYSLRELAGKLSEATPWKIEIEPMVRDVRLEVEAHEMPLRKLLWAVLVASGNELRLKKEGILTIARQAPQDEWMENDTPGMGVPLFQLAGTGYASPLLNPEIKKRVEERSRLKAGPGERSVVWRYADLPLLYRTAIDKTIPKKLSPSIVYPVPTHTPEETTIVWLAGINVEVGLYTPRLAGGGYTFFLPAF